MALFKTEDHWQYVLTMKNYNMNKIAEYYFDTKTRMCHLFVSRHRDFDRYTFPIEDLRSYVFNDIDNRFEIEKFSLEKMIFWEKRC
jgi:hypothetical protein